MQLLVNNEFEYSFAITYGNRTTFYTSTNLDSLDNSGDSQVVVTNKPRLVVVERTVDFVSWEPVFTNLVYAGHIQTFTDLDAPADRGFYRVMAQ